MPLINPALLDQYRLLHETTRYGASATFLAREILACLVDLKPAAVLEYGCGKSRLIEVLPLDGIVWTRYDPAIPAFETIKGTRFDFVVSTDVMEHIPACDVDAVLRHMRSYGDKAFFNISTRPATRLLPNGTNAHCTVWDAPTWLNRIRVVYPEANCVYRKEGDSCVIITWRSPVGVLIDWLRSGNA